MTELKLSLKRRKHDLKRMKLRKHRKNKPVNLSTCDAPTPTRPIKAPPELGRRSMVDVVKNKVRAILPWR